MTELRKSIYYVNKTILDIVQNKFILVDKKDWYELSKKIGQLLLENGRVEQIPGKIFFET
tara:strand:- start:723 stop:902 length:180 start_codon:yes stop_codon:yes gene_type:complete